MHIEQLCHSHIQRRAVGEKMWVMNLVSLASLAMNRLKCSAGSKSGGG